ncbi:UNVERIFIED_CONTAM: hypothetical protein Sindi_0459400 [Sesamum indicum]
MTLKCTSHRKNRLSVFHKLESLRQQFAEKESNEKILIAENESLEGVIADREEGMEEGYKTCRLDGIEEAFQTVVEIKVVRFFGDGFNTCKAQVNTLKAFAETFDQGQLKPGLDRPLAV